MNAAASEKAPFFSKKSNVVLTAVFYTFLWGSAFPLVKLCMEQFGIADGDEASKCLVAGIRFLISGLVLLLIRYGKTRRRAPLSRAAFLKITGYGVLSTTVQYAFTYIGLSRIAGSVGAVYDQCSVFFTVIAGGLLLKSDFLNTRKILGCVLGFVGIAAVSLGSDLSPLSSIVSFSLGGEGMMLCAALCQTAAYLIAKTTADAIPAELLVGWGQFLGGILLTAGALAAGGGITGCTLPGILILLALSGISAAAYVLSLLPLRYFPASETASFNLLIPVFGTALSALLLGENILHWKYPVSLLLISAGILAINRSAHIKNDRKDDAPCYGTASMKTGAD